MEYATKFHIYVGEKKENKHTKYESFIIWMEAVLLRAVFSILYLQDKEKLIFFQLKYSRCVHTLLNFQSEF